MLLLLGNATWCNGQEITPTHSKNNWYINGDLAIISSLTVNYENRFAGLSTSSRHVYGRLGAGVGADVFGSELGPVAVSAVHVLFGQYHRHFEIGGGVMYQLNGNYPLLLPVVDIGYRFQPTEGTLFRIHLANVDIGVSVGAVL